MRKIILGVLLLVLATNVAGATDYAYAITDDLSNVYVKVDLTEGTNTFYAEKTNGYASNPNNVYELYDGAESGVPADVWTFVSGTGTIDYSSAVSKYGSKAILVDGDAKPFFASIQTVPDDVVIECYVRWEGSEQNGFVCARTSSANPTFYAVRNMVGATNLYRSLSDTYVLLDSGTAPNAGTTTWQKYTFRVVGTDIKWYIDDVLADSATDANIASGGVGIRGGYSSSGIYVDDIKVRKAMATDPVVFVVDNGNYYTIYVNSDEASSGYQIPVPCEDIGVSSTTESIRFTDVDLSGPAPAEVFDYDIAEDLSNVYFEADVPASSTEVFYVIDESGHSPTVLEYALNFDGSNDYATVPHSSELTLTDYFKIRTTVRIDSGVGSGHWTALVSKGSGTVADGGGQDHNYALAIENNLFTGGQTLMLLFENSAGVNYDVSYDLSNLNFGEWYLIEGEWDTSTDELILYVNGVEVSKETGVTGTPNANTQAVTIGIPCISASNMEYFDGVIGEIEILSSTGRVAKYEINDGSGTTLTDKTGNHAGTINGATWVESEPFDTSAVSTSVINMGGYYKISVTNHEASSLVDYPIPIPCNQIGVSSTTQSILITDEAPVEEEVYYDPTPGGRYSDMFGTIFPDDEEEMSGWGILKNTISAWGLCVGSEVFWLFILPIPIAAYWIMTGSTELPIVVYLILGGIFVKVAPEVMQTPARMMLLFGITGMLYHFFKNRG